ncbi:MAG: hypothetical protein H0V89_03380 [Deltaproteobacteria bacterium]|nr:hypothetical protein [Deltaproteobacteria bacterium]
MIDRRDFLGSLGLLALGACGPHAVRAYPVESSAPDYLATAREVGTYLRGQAVATEHGQRWRKSPDEPGTMSRDLYHGAAGPALFFLELHRATGDATYLRDAQLGGDELIATIPEAPGIWDVGLYGGLAGHAFVFAELARATGEARHRDAAARSITLLEAASSDDGHGGATYGGSTDILYGAAGVILGLLHGRPSSPAIAFATRLGDGLVGLAQTTPHGRRWLMRPDDDYEMPNFSHGTAGVAYALARLHQVTGEARFLEAALAGASHLLGLASSVGDTCLLPHVLPKGEDRFYLGFCHGPAGTARLFHQLHVVTGDATWANWFQRSVNGVLVSGVPTLRAPGFWDNVGQCCGTASLAELMLSMHRLDGDPHYLELAHELEVDLLSRASQAAGGGLEWIHAENRAEPYWKQAYTGWMQGAAGIGSVLIRLAGHDGREAWKIALPDNPFPV